MINRRGFLGAAIAGLTALVAHPVQPLVHSPLGDLILRCRAKRLALEALLLEQYFWGPPTEAPMGIGYWIAPSGAQALDVQ